LGQSDKVFSGQAFDFVMYTASPVFDGKQDDENELIRPAVEGTESVIRACIKHGMKRCVVTSSIQAIINPLVEGNTYTGVGWTDVILVRFK